MSTNCLSKILIIGFLFLITACSNEELSYSFVKYSKEPLLMDNYTYVLDACKEVDVEKAKNVAKMFGHKNILSNTRGEVAEKVIRDVELFR